MAHSRTRGSSMLGHLVFFRAAIDQPAADWASLAEYRRNAGRPDDLWLGCRTRPLQGVKIFTHLREAVKNGTNVHQPRFPQKLQTAHGGFNRTVRSKAKLQQAVAGLQASNAALNASIQQQELSMMEPPEMTSESIGTFVSSFLIPSGSATTKAIVQWRRVYSAHTTKQLDRILEHAKEYRDGYEGFNKSVTTFDEAIGEVRVESVDEQGIIAHWPLRMNGDEAALADANLRYIGRIDAKFCPVRILNTRMDAESGKDKAAGRVLPNASVHGRRAAWKRANAKGYRTSLRP
ncbi:MAG: hypothetical protein Q9208_002726 [Pyrenodesmia sp. 3 TL-2023]